MDLRPKLKPSDPLMARKPVKYYEALQNQSVKRAVWMSTILLHRVVKAGSCGDSGQGGWLDDVSNFVYFVHSEDGPHTEPTIVYDDDFFDLPAPWGTDTGPGKNILEESD